MEVEELVDAVKEAVDEKLQPLEERLAALEESKSTKSEDGEGASGEAGSGSGDGEEEEDSSGSNGAEVSDGLKDAIKEAVAAAVEEQVAPVNKELQEFKDGINKIVGSSKSIVGQEGDDGGEGDTKTATKSAPRRDAWGRKVRTNQGA